MMKQKLPLDVFEQVLEGRRLRRNRKIKCVLTWTFIVALVVLTVYIEKMQHDIRKKVCAKMAAELPSIYCWGFK